MICQIIRIMIRAVWRCV